MPYNPTEAALYAFTAEALHVYLFQNETHISNRDERDLESHQALVHYGIGLNHNGIETTKVAPYPTLASYQIRPLCKCTAHAQMARPRPVDPL